MNNHDLQRSHLIELEEQIFLSPSRQVRTRANHRYNKNQANPLEYFDYLSHQTSFSVELPCWEILSEL